MTDKDKLQKIAKSITKAETISLYCHVSPDGDTLASALAVYSALAKQGKKVDVYCDGAVPEKYSRLKNACVVSLPGKGVRDLALAIDCDAIDRLGGGMKSFLSAREQMSIDHHRTHEKFADVSYVDADAAACAECVYELLKLMKLLDVESAELLFAGIVADSGCFQFSSTTQHTHEIACELMAYGFDAASVIYDVFKRIRPEVFALKNRVLSRCKLYEDGKIAIINFRDEDFAATDTVSSDTEGIIVGAIDIDGVEVAYAISEAGEKNWKISARTKKYVDASDICRAFGGGGHIRAAGCRLNGFYEDVVDKLVKAARDRLL